MLIAVKEIQLKNPQHPPNNVMEPLKKELDARTKQRMQADVVITTNNKQDFMNSSLLFAIDKDTNEVIVSKSYKGTNKINFIERIKQSDNEMFFNAVVTLTSITKSSSFDERTFKSMDKVCQMMYYKHKEIKG